MTYKKIIAVISFFFLFASIHTNAQQKVRIAKKDFLIHEVGAEEAWQHLKAGNKAFRKDQFVKAIDHYLDAYQYNSQSAELAYKLGISYLNTPRKGNAIEYLNDAIELNENVTFDVHYLVARAYHLSTEFDSAIFHYNAFKESLELDDLDAYRKDIDKKINECRDAKKLIKQPVRSYIDNLGAFINTEYPEYCPVILGDDSVMIFTSERPSTLGGNRSSFSNNYYEDIYKAQKLDNGTWNQALNFGKPFNTKSNDAAISLSPEGDKLFIYRGDDNMGDIYVSEYEDFEWQKPKSLSKEINNKNSHETSASLLAGDSIIYFVSDKEDDNFGKHDIYFSTRDVKGKWTEARNAGVAVNTPFDEAWVMVTPDGKTMYFSSTGHNTMGGYDVFKSIKDNSGEWTKPVNIGYPINTPHNELFFNMMPNGKIAYYASVRSDGYGELDIYQVTFLGEEKPSYQNFAEEDNLIMWKEIPVLEVDIEPAIESTVLQGKIADAATGEPVEAIIEIIDRQKDEVLHTASSSKETGDYKIALPAGKDYNISIKAKGYMLHSDQIMVEKSKKFQVIERDFQINPIEIGSKVILKNVFFDSGKATLRTESYSELNALIKFMKDNPKVKIEISGHTDNVGSLATNKRLSKARAESVKNYIISKGIEPGRLTAEGYAYTQPIATNETDEGRQLNRRVEAKVIDK